jgi:TetR/AcrR family transcriptional repressor of bet genes
MAKHGYHGASINKIAKEAGLASGLVLYHFESKGEILLHAVQSLVDSFEERYQARLSLADSDPERELDAFIDAHLALGDDADPEAVAAWVVVGAQAVQNEEVRAAFAESVSNRLAELERILRAVHRSREQSSRGTRQMAAAILSAIEGCFLLSSSAASVLPRGYAAPSVRAMVRGLLR